MPNRADYEKYLVAKGVSSSSAYHGSLNQPKFCALANDVLTGLGLSPTYTSIYGVTDLDILKAIDDRIAAKSPTDTLLNDALVYAYGACKYALLYYVGHLRDSGLATNENSQQFQVLSRSGNIALNKPTTPGPAASNPPLAPSSTKPYNGPLNLILYGPPGTGKTYNSINYAVAIIENEDIAVIEGEKREDVRKRYQNYIDSGQIVFTTFHQSMSYEDFIEGIKPEFDPTSKTLSYPVKPGIFKKLVDKIKNPPTPSGAFAPIAAAGQQQPQNDGDNREDDGDPRYVIIIDEINRGNVSQIFGELITLIEEDKREGNLEAMSATLPYSGEPFSVPNNLYILGTMNTADRSVEALDTALRRRFSFKEMMPQPSLLTNSLCGYVLTDILDRINQRIAYLKDREHQIGHSYFMGCDSEEKLKNVFKDKIVPLLQEYFYGNVEYIGLTLGSAFVKEINEVSFPTLNDVDVPAEPAASYRVLDEAEWEALDVAAAITELMK